MSPLPSPFRLKHRRCHFFGSGFSPIVTAMAQLLVTRAVFTRSMSLAGLDDAQVFEAVRFIDVKDLITALFPDVVTKLDDEAQSLAEAVFSTAAKRACFGTPLGG